MTVFPAPPLDPSRLRGLVFDLDGTLVDSFRAIATAANAARAACGFPPLSVDEVRRRVGGGLRRLMLGLVGDEHLDTGIATFERVYAEVYLDDTDETPGALATLAALRERGFRLTVASNKPAAFCAPLLDRLGMLTHLDAVEAPETAGSTKPHPAMVRRCLAAMRTTAEHAAYVGDMPLDVETAGRAGVPVILVACGGFGVDDLRATGHTSVATLPDLLALVPGRPLGETP